MATYNPCSVIQRRCGSLPESETDLRRLVEEIDTIVSRCLIPPDEEGCLIEKWRSDDYCAAGLRYVGAKLGYCAADPIRHVPTPTEDGKITLRVVREER